MAQSVIKIGNASGYWGDDPTALLRQVEGGRLDYISMDFLAEITMSIMQKQRARDPKAGFARDFIPMLERVLAKTMKERTCIITNAGGINPEACADAVLAMAVKAGLKPRIAVVHGDDILSNLKVLRERGAPFVNMETGAAFDDVAHRIEAANVYFGAAPVAAALKGQPDIVITGRVTDTGITLGPMMHAFGWRLDDWNKLAAGIVAGHIIECGSQATGGNFTDWRLVSSYARIGYPIIEASADGSFVVTKHPGSGGLVSVDTVREQLFYEMGNPGAYITPDVVADFGSIQLAAAGNDRVVVTGIRGFEPTPLYKISMAYSDGYKCVGEIGISGPSARAKAEAFAQLFWERAGRDFGACETEFLGLDACHRSLAGREEGNEVVLRLGARDNDPKKLQALAKFVPSIILGGPPGVFVLGGLPSVREIVSYWPTLMDKRLIKPRLLEITADGVRRERPVQEPAAGQFAEDKRHSQSADRANQTAKDAMAMFGRPKPGHQVVPLEAIALARSGDKGDTANIGVMARSRAAYEFLASSLSAQMVKDLFQELCLGRVTRYEVENLLGFNFLLESALGGGGTMTLRADAQGKTFAQGLLRQMMSVPDAVLKTVNRAHATGSQG